MDGFTGLIVDDEPLLRRLLDKYLAELWPELDIVGMAGNGKDAVKMAQEHQPDVVFMDIRMPEMDGLTATRKMANFEKQPLVVFITAFEQHAVTAFEQEAVDYILKPVEMDRLDASLDRVKSRLTENARTKEAEIPYSEDLVDRLMAHFEHKSEPKYLDWLKVSRRDSIHLISIEDVYYFKAADKYTTVVTAEGESIIRTSIKELKSQLDPSLFWQIHRGTLVQSKQIERVKRDFTGRMNLYLVGCNDKLPVSRNFQNLFKQM
ncbi:LytTR family DNA-binding domain-containing protein [Vibrio sp. Of7-15]|uniref:LytR/AlgR family response regulator transcription factor n=1 Tax=Vibrio sp. Of7-15 TaxID=2724879 RepID=UPI001EF195A5|nr:LytTR family DNA-binding domain-containing protein [Vibrio sp. Of7-15]MCG7495646.1 LytTR family DNA-binding domain-containing protein [Vibrio sp. Of7-15]